ncbi:ATP-dependent DNA ligase [Candidatus Woesearchaeota archaeon]|nr:ATP-dependent DNA ligase [Candidatus Woesearchaeota archaeon]
MKYEKLADVYQTLENTTKRLEKTHLVAQFLKTADDPAVIILVQGRVFPNWDQRELGMANKLVVKAIALASGASTEKLGGLWKETGDLGKTAEKLMQKKSQSSLFSSALTVKKVFDNLHKIAELEGSGSVERKVQLVAELLTSAKPIEAKYIVRTVLGELRVGLGDGTIRDALIWAFFGKEAGITYDEKEKEVTIPDREVYENYSTLVQEAFDATNDFAEVFELLREKGAKGLEHVEVKPGKPVKVMLFQKAKTIAEGLETVGTPAAAEYKYDGFRLQIHKTNGKITLFTRRLENVTEQFPDVVEMVKKHVGAGRFIMDSEVAGIDKKTKKYLAFQSISQRIKRKYDIHELAEKFPVEVNVFDIINYDGKSLLKTPFEERREILENIVDSLPLAFKLSEKILVKSEAEADAFYKKSLLSGNEGIMLKNLHSVYKPGSRVGFGVKVKPTMDTLEVVITGAEWGEGKRGKWLASFMIGVRNEDDEIVEIGRVGTGIKEKEEEGLSFGQLTKLLLPDITEEKGREVKVKPKIVIEVNYEEIQKSPTYSSGYALRFPRLVRMREDRGINDINTLADVQELAEGQRGRGSQ